LVPLPAAKYKKIWTNSFSIPIDSVAIHYPKGDEIKEQKLPDLIGDRVLRNLVLESIYDEKGKTMSKLNIIY
jgi:hypothetical protein